MALELGESDILDVACFGHIALHLCLHSVVCSRLQINISCMANIFSEKVSSKTFSYIVVKYFFFSVLHGARKVTELTVCLILLNPPPGICLIIEAKCKMAKEVLIEIYGFSSLTPLVLLFCSLNQIYLWRWNSSLSKLSMEKMKASPIPGLRMSVI